jgi:hypothetical protein
MPHDLEPHHLIGQKLHCPARSTLWLGTAGNGNQLRFGVSIKHLLHAGANLLFTLQCRVQPLFHEPLPQVFNRANAQTIRLRRIGILHLQTSVRFVHRQQDIRMPNAVRRRLAAANQYPQTLLFLSLQPNNILFHIDPP